MVSDPITIIFILALVVFISIWLEERYKLFRSLGAALVGILFAMVLSNVGILPGNSTAYEILVGPIVSAGIVLILLSVDIGSIRKAGPVMLKAFAIGAVGTAIGAIVMGLILVSSIGEETWKLTGQFTGTYTGGGLNFAAVGQALGTSSYLFTAAIAADVLVTAFWMIACLSAPLFLGRKNSKADNDVQTKSDSQEVEKFTFERSLYSSGKSVALLHIAALAAIAIGALWGSSLLASWFSFLPKILWLTTITLLIAQIPAIKKLSGSAMLGNYLLLLFLSLFYQ